MPSGAAGSSTVDGAVADGAAEHRVGSSLGLAADDAGRAASQDSTYSVTFCVGKAVSRQAEAQVSGRFRSNPAVVYPAA